MLTGRHIVLIEDDALMGNSLVQRLELEGAEVTWVRQAVRAVSAVRSPRKPVDAVVCDIRLPDGTGEDVFGTLSRTIAPPPFLFITGQGEIDQAVRLLKAGGADYLSKPFEMPDFLDRLTRLLRPEQESGLPAQTGISALARQVDTLVADFAALDRPVLIRGARGLGKGRLARQLHALSDRRAAPFVAVNAFRDDVSPAALDRAIEEVADGTLFLNGVGRLDRPGQDRLMDALADAPFRLIASCGPHIDEKVAAGGFRPDLLYVLMEHEIAVPSLAQRRDDAAWLAGQLFDTLNAARGGRLRGISDLGLAAIRDHDWPGNGRELRSRILRALEVATGEWIQPSDLFPELETLGAEPVSLAQARDQAERRQIIHALERAGGHPTKAARMLKVSRTTLWEKMRRLGLSDG